MADKLLPTLCNFFPLVFRTDRDVSRPHLLRQLWGLTVRCERAMRAIAPHWQAQKASWGEEACLFEYLTSPALWLCQLATTMSKDSQSFPKAIFQLLASSVATVLKAARFTCVNADFALPCKFAVIPALRQSITGALPATISLLLPRMAAANSLQGASPTLLCAVRAVDSALLLSQWKGLKICPVMVLGSCHMAALVSRVVAELLEFSGPATTSRYAAHDAVGKMSCYASCLSAHIFNSAARSCVGDPSALALMRDILAPLLLRLLHSPLLDTLVALQHVMFRALPSIQQPWEASAAASVCQMQLPPESMEADAMDSKVAMQVGHTYYSEVMHVGHTYYSGAVTTVHILLAIH